MKKTVVVHSGGMDSSICLALAIKEFGAKNVLSLSFRYNQRHSIELERASLICQDWKVDHSVIEIGCLKQITSNALTDSTQEIQHIEGEAPNTLVIGRNGLMARVAAIHAQSIGATSIYMGVIEVEEANSGYRDCSRNYMDIIQSALRLDFDDEQFEIRTPIVKMDKTETMELAKDLGVLEYLLEQTITCYEGIEKSGCGKCPACKLRNEGIKGFLKLHPDTNFSYKNQI